MACLVRLARLPSPKVQIESVHLSIGLGGRGAAVLFRRSAFHAPGGGLAGSLESQAEGAWLIVEKCIPAWLGSNKARPSQAAPTRPLNGGQ